MKITNLSHYLNKFKIKIPETSLKENLVRMIVESRSERMVEIPNILANIPRRKSKILDIGCRYSLLPLQLASLGHQVIGVDIHKYNGKHPNFSFVKMDFLKTPFKAGFFDLVISLSTIEHFGFGFYGEKKFADGDNRAVQRIHKILKKGGVFLLTAPFGKPIDSAWYRVYNLTRIKNLLKGFKINQIKVYRVGEGAWLPVDIDEAEEIDCSKEVSCAFLMKTVKIKEFKSTDNNGESNTKASSCKSNDKKSYEIF